MTLETAVCERPWSDAPRSGAGAAPVSFRRTLDRELRRALVRRARDSGRAGPGAYEAHLLKWRPGRRAAVFLGRTARRDPGIAVEWGWVVKVTNPRRASRLAAHYEQIERALATERARDRVRAAPEAGGAHARPRDVPLPRVPAVAIARPECGWIALEAWTGTPLSLVRDAGRRMRALAVVAGALARLEQCREAWVRWPAREWTVADELRRLEVVWSRAGGSPPVPLEKIGQALARTGRGPLVPAHRDLYHEQIVVEESAEDPGAERWVDWDEATLAPAGLDLGNLLAHERLSELHGTGARLDADAICVHALLAYHGAGGALAPKAVAAWEAVACLRLAGLALQRARGDDPVVRNPVWRDRTAADPRTEAEALIAAAQRLAFSG